MKHALSALATLISSYGMLACTGTDTGNPFSELDGEGTAGSCTETETELEATAQTPLGFSPQELIDLVSGEHQSSLAWLQSDIQYGPESGRSEIVLDVQPLGAVRLVERAPRTASGAGEGPAIGELYSPCNDSLELDVRIQLSTAGGAFDERIETTLEATRADFARGAFSLDLSALEGAFDAEPVVPPGTEVTRSFLSVQMGFSAYGSVGAFSLSNEFRSLDGSAIGQGGSGEIAHYPAEDYCGPAAVSVTADQSVRGLSMAQALAELDAMSPTPVRYASAEPAQLTLDFQSTEATVCVQLGQSAGSVVADGMTALEFAARVALASSDGRIEGEVPVQITASSEGGPLTIRAQADADTGPEGAAGLPAQFGIQDAIDFSGYDGATVQLSALASEASTGGSLRVYGLDVADCVTNPPPFDPESMSAPGCRGTDRIQLWSASWGGPTDP